MALCYQKFELSTHDAAEIVHRQRPLHGEVFLQGGIHEAKSSTNQAQKTCKNEAKGCDIQVEHAQAKTGNAARYYHLLISASASSEATVAALMSLSASDLRVV